MERDIFEELRKELENNNLTPEEKTRLIKQAGNEYNKQADKQFYRTVGKSVLGASIEVAAMLAPIGAVGAGTRVAGKVGLAALEKKFGKKIVQDTIASAIDGALASSIFGAGRGLLENKNILTSSIQDAVLGLGMGGLTGASVSYLQKLNHAKILENYKTGNNMSLDEMKKLRAMGKNYYKNYLQDRKIDSSFLGQINIPGSQAGEINLHNSKMIPKIPEQIETAKSSTYSNDKPFRLDSDYFKKLYNTYKNKEFEYVIRKNSNNTGYDFYQIKEVGSNPAYLNQNQALELEPNIIMYDYLEKNNPAEWLNSQLTTELLGATYLSKDKIEDSLNDFHAQSVEDAVPGALKGRVYEEGSPNNYEDYKNPKTNSTKIYTIEEFEDMSPEEYEVNKQEIHAQIGEIGLPTKKEVETSKPKEQKNDTNGKKGRWITKNGNHIFIEE